MRDYVHIVLVSGGREHPNSGLVWRCLDAVLFVHGAVCVVTGACPTGADLYAEQWAKKRQQIYMGFPAEWDKYQKRAGMRRNGEMLGITEPHQAIVFAGGPGSGGMARLCQEWVKTGDLKYLWLPEGEFWK